MKKTLSSTLGKSLAGASLALAALGAAAPSQAELTANVGLTNNYLWRGLTQTMNETAVQGGLDYANASGFYAGTWVSNVAFDPADVYSYEHDLYFGFAGEAGGFSYDLGYLYYNYDENAGFDFGEVYGTIGFGNLGVSLYMVANTEADEAPGQDFGFGETFYGSVDYAIPLANEVEVGLHLGYHDGDFAEAFNGVTDSYIDYNVSIAKDGFSAMVSMTDLDSDGDGDGVEDYANMSTRDNDEIKFVVGYSLDFTL